jgi:hypothetical protein
MREAARLDELDRRLGRLKRRPSPRKRPGGGSAPALVEPPRGPRPLQGGAAAPLEFED